MYLFYLHNIPRYTLLPQSKFAKVWEWVMFSMSLVSVFTVSFQATFLHAHPALLTINYMIEVTFIADMSVEFSKIF